MEQFKGTKGPWKSAIVHAVCIGVEADLGDGYSQMIVNTILPDTDKQYDKEKKEILANVALIAAAHDLLDACQTVVDGYETDGMEQMGPRDEAFYKYCKAAINKALNNQPRRKAITRRKA